MKQIKNWKKATVCDIETDGLLDSVTKMHILYYHMANGKAGSIDGSDEPELERFLQWHIDNDIPIAGHNFIGYDVPAMEKIFGYNLEDLMVIDTMALSWYLNPKRKSHALATFLEDYGIEKVKVLDSEWEGLTEEEEGLLQRIEKSSGLYKELKEKQKQHKDLMFKRCKEDVAINTEMWKDFIQRLEDMYTKAKQSIDANLVGGKRVSDDEEIYLDSFKGKPLDYLITNCIEYLMFKMDCLALQQYNPFVLDVPYVEETIAQLQEEIEKARVELEAVMPDVPKYTTRNEPKNPKKKDGTLSIAGERWNNLISNLDTLDEYGNKIAYFDEEKEVVKELRGYAAPNINSSDQIKSFLFQHGWKPETFKYVKDEDKMQIWVDSGFKKSLKPETRKIPQVTKDGDEGKELCHSVVKMSDEIPEIAVYSRYNLLTHRLGVLEGFIKNQNKDGTITAGARGLTNTLRFRHSNLVNLVGVSRLYGEEIRGALTVPDSGLVAGADVSSLEDTIKHHFMIPHDPDYVKTMMQEDYDPHITMALTANMVTQKEFDDFMVGIKSDNAKTARHKGKQTNYASVYGSGAETLARTAGIPIKEAETLLKAYWELNWSVKVIAEEQQVIQDSLGNKWLINPINGILYEVRKEADYFSTLIQGFGAYIFDMWVSNILDLSKEKFKRKSLTANFHDEFVSLIKDNQKSKDSFGLIVKEAMDLVNKKYKLRKELGFDLQFGKRYSDVH